MGLHVHRGELGIDSLFAATCLRCNTVSSAPDTVLGVRRLFLKKPTDGQHRRDENTKLKRLVADLSLDKVMLQDVLQKKF